MRDSARTPYRNPWAHTREAAVLELIGATLGTAVTLYVIAELVDRYGWAPA